MPHRALRRRRPRALTVFVARPSTPPPARIPKTASTAASWVRRILSDQKFSLGSAAGAVVAAGLRPCSGAILILVFTLAQGIFKAGCAAVLAMSAGTALTTGALAAATVFARRLAQNWAGAERRPTDLALRGAELVAAALVLLLGLALLLGASVAQAA